MTKEGALSILLVLEMNERSDLTLRYSAVRFFRLACSGVGMHKFLFRSGWAFFPVRGGAHIKLPNQVAISILIGIAIGIDLDYSA